MAVVAVVALPAGEALGKAAHVSALASESQVYRVMPKAQIWKTELDTAAFCPCPAHPCTRAHAKTHVAIPWRQQPKHHCLCHRRSRRRCGLNGTLGWSASVITKSSAFQHRSRTEKHVHLMCLQQQTWSSLKGNNPSSSREDHIGQRRCCCAEMPPPLAAYAGHA